MTYKIGSRGEIVKQIQKALHLYEDGLFGINTEEAVSLIVNGYAKEVINKLPMEFAVEAQKLLGVSLEGSVG